MNAESSDTAAGPLRMAVAASRFNRFIVAELVAGACAAMTRHGILPVNQEVVWVPGAFELPLLADQMARTGRFDAIIALGAVIRGGTPHFDFVAGECARGLGRVALDHGVPVSFGVLTTDNIEQALERAGTGAGNKGFDAAMVAIEMVATLRALRRHPSGRDAADNAGQETA